MPVNRVASQVENEAIEVPGPNGQSFYFAFSLTTVDGSRLRARVCIRPERTRPLRILTLMAGTDPM